MTTTTNTIQVRRDTSANWTTNNPIPKAGEWCFETDTGVTKIGDGATRYASLTPIGKTTATTSELNILDGATVTTSELNVLDGITATTTELNYTDGVTSNIQTQLNAKVNTSAVKSSFSATTTNSNVPSEKLTKDSLDLKQDILTQGCNTVIADNVVSAISLVNDGIDGTEYNEPTTYTKVNALAHSSFERSKFTVVGSPIITDDGIASGFSASNYLKSNIDITPTTKLVIENEFVVNGTSSAQMIYTFNSDDLYRVSVESATQIRFSGIGNALSVTVPSLSAGTKVRTKTTITTSNIKLEVIIGGTTYQNNRDEAVTFSALTFVTIGALRNGNYPFTGSIDLKQFQITVDEVHVFSGNKTGIDTIKADNYTVVGSPTITDDGVASGFSSSNKIYTSINSSATSYKEIKVSFVYNSGISGGIYCDSTSGEKLVCGSNLSYYSNPTTSIVTLANYATSLSLSDGDTVNVSLRISSTTTITASANNLSASASATDATSSLNLAYIYIGMAASNGYLSLPTSIDLNSFKIYVDGNLVYQPCLKIPYTKANNGQKFAAMTYKDRVADMFTQKHYAPYMLIDTTNSKWVFPYSSIDSRLANSVVIDSYRSGTSMYRKYLNRILVQCGSCTSGTAVTFPCSTAFADTNYIITATYSAKTTTGFTPSQTGEYIAIGKF